MNDAFRLCAIAMTGALCSLLLKKTNPNISIVCAVVSAALLIISVLGSIGDILSGIKSISADLNINGAYILLAMKIMGISLVFDITGGILERMGESALSKNLMTAGRVVLMSMTLPTLFSLIELVGGLLEVVR